tara:strand:- start:1242 stop:2201 length:960 start_codon:yes stop_codon:yes gene_type:complete
MDSLNGHFQYIDSLSDTNHEKSMDNCCKSRMNYIYDNDIIKCKICTNIISNITNHPEWRYYGSTDSKSSDPTRCGMPINTLLPESSVGSTVSYKNNSKTMNQIRKYQQWNGMPYKERSLYKVFLEIQEICRRYNLPIIIINESKSLYSIISQTKISRGSNRKGIIAACVYFACKECDAPRSTKEISEMFGIKIPVMTKGVKKCQEIIHMNKKNKTRLTKNTNAIQPIDFIERFCNKLNINEIKTQEIINICKYSIQLNIVSENTPPSIAAGCIFYFLKEDKDNHITRKNISDICKISEVTINKCAKKLEKNQKDLDKLG